MKIRAIKTISGQTPMQESFDVSVFENEGQDANLICLFPEIQYQEVKGFGGAFTEAASNTLDQLSEENRQKILQLYFDKTDGIGYNYGRIHMNSCDFSLGNYACVAEGDDTLETFNIKRDKKSLIPMILDAMQYGEIDLLASPWSPPAFMKTNGQMNGGGKLKPEYYEAWSRYFGKFIAEYKKNGIEIKTVTVQNEAAAAQTWDSCVYTAEEERDFVKNYLGPKLREIGVEILFWDHNKERLVERAQVVLGDEAAANYIAGIAMHWYSGDHFEQVGMVKELYPDKDVVFSEGCWEYTRGTGDDVGIGEKYAHDIIGNFNHHCNVFCDWNLLLDENGGPNHVGNFCHAPIMADTKHDTVRVHASYYYIGHFSKFVQKGAKRIGSSKWTHLLDTVSFQNPDGSIVSVVLNMTEEDRELNFRLKDKIIRAKAEAHSIATYIFEK